MYHVQAADPVEAVEIPEYEGPHDDDMPNFNLELDEDDLPSVSVPCHKYNLRPRQKRTCSPARRAAPPPETVPR